MVPNLIRFGVDYFFYGMTRCVYACVTQRENVFIVCSREEKNTF